MRAVVWGSLWALAACTPFAASPDSADAGGGAIDDAAAASDAPVPLDGPSGPAVGFAWCSDEACSDGTFDWAATGAVTANAGQCFFAATQGAQSFLSETRVAAGGTGLALSMHLGAAPLGVTDSVIASMSSTTGFVEIRVRAQQGQLCAGGGGGQGCSAPFSFTPKTNIVLFVSLMT